MSWQQYVDSNLVGTGKILKAAIHGHDGNVWATTKGFSVSTTEMKTLADAFLDASGIRAGGIHLAGVKYFALTCNDRSIYGKKGAGGVICVKTKQAILIGVYDEPVQPGEATKVVENLADYLISVNY
ncbi:profilin, required for normal timing of actin polymerization in response to thermal stress [Lobulomyces angularis]|nr:profilin, required for normal timing of actin polymerization in response to thermal stress [Lobulomyces angularis]